MASLEFTVNLETIQCAACAMTFAVPKRFETDRREDHATFYCPSGHPNVFNGETESEKLRRERDRLAQRIAERDDDVKRQRERAEAAERCGAAARGQVTKIKNRVGHGVCPCCNRTFENLARHMGSQHPTFTAQAAE